MTPQSPNKKHEELPPRIWVGRQWNSDKFKSGTWRKEQAPFYAVPFVPEELILQARARIAELEREIEMIHQNAAGAGL